MSVPGTGSDLPADEAGGACPHLKRQSLKRIKGDCPRFINQINVEEPTLSSLPLNLINLTP